MTFIRFGNQDIVYNTIVAKPEYKFIIHSGTVYREDDILLDGDFSNKIKHIKNGEVSLHELNINRPADSLVYAFIDKSTTRYAYRTISTSNFDDASQFQYGSTLTQSYPHSSSISRIFIDQGQEFNSQGFQNVGAHSFASSNKKYIRALNNVINHRDTFGQEFSYSDLGTKKVNMICVPGIFYGSKIDKGSVKLNYYVTGTLKAQLTDKNKDGVLIQSSGSEAGYPAGVIIYEQGLMLLTGSWDLVGSGHVDNFFQQAALLKQHGYHLVPGYRT